MHIRFERLETNNKLKLNEDETEMILVTPKRTRSNSLPLTIGLNEITPAETVRNLNVHLDEHLSFQQHISFVCRTCYLELRRISSIRHCLSEDATKTLVCSFLLSRLDYCNSLLAGCPKHLVSRLQKVQNNADRLIFRRS